MVKIAPPAARGRRRRHDAEPQHPRPHDRVGAHTSAISAAVAGSWSAASWRRSQWPHQYRPPRETARPFHATGAARPATAMTTWVRGDRLIHDDPTDCPTDEHHQHHHSNDRPADDDHEHHHSDDRPADDHDDDSGEQRRASRLDDHDFPERGDVDDAEYPSVVWSGDDDLDAPVERAAAVDSRCDRLAVLRRRRLVRRGTAPARRGCRTRGARRPDPARTGAPRTTSFVRDLLGDHQRRGVPGGHGRRRDLDRLPGGDDEHPGGDRHRGLVAELRRFRPVRPRARDGVGCHLS